MTFTALYCFLYVLLSVLLCSFGANRSVLVQRLQEQHWLTVLSHSSIHISINFPLYWYPWLSVSTIIPLNFNVSLSDIQDFANLWPLFILRQVHCDKIAHFNVRLSAVRRMLLFISANLSST